LPVPKGTGRSDEHPRGSQLLYCQNRASAGDRSGHDDAHSQPYNREHTYAVSGCTRPDCPPILNGYRYRSRHVRINARSCRRIVPLGRGIPVPAIYDGDLVTIQVAPNVPRGLAPNDVDVRVLVDGMEVVTGHLNWRKFSGQMVGLYEWVWDSSEQPGIHLVTAILDPANLIHIGDQNVADNMATTVLTVRSRSLLSEVDAEAAWVVAAGDCCTLHAVSGTAAHRDLEQLISQVDAAFLQASVKLNEPLAADYDVYFIDRIIGQGGYATDSMVVSYLDRNYVGGGLNELLVHEAVHLIDRQFAPNRLAFLSEGLAVWAAGGHYRPADLDLRMVALVEMGRYEPVTEVIENFYDIQHEIGYLEAAGLITYLVKTYDWPQVRAFYANTTADDGPTLAGAIDVNMKLSFDRTLEEVEADWMAYLKGLSRDRGVISDLRATIRFYNMLRRYQVAYDPTAYFMDAWLPTPGEAVKLGATADMTRHPESTLNVALETMLYAANIALQGGDLSQANALISSVGRVLINDGQFLDPLANAYLDIVQSATAMGYEVQQINLSGDEAIVLVTGSESTSVAHLHLLLQEDQDWAVTR